MKSQLSSRIWIVACSLIAQALVAGCAAGFGVYVVNRLSQDGIYGNLPPIELNASTAARTKSMSMATGLVDDKMEALFALDHVSGNLQCWVLNPRTGNVGGTYRANVASDLRIAGKTGEPDYLMTTGGYFFDGNETGNIFPGKSICYVADATSGNVVGYALLYNKQAIIRGEAQNGVLRVVCKGSARSSSASEK